MAGDIFCRKIGVQCIDRKSAEGCNKNVCLMRLISKGGGEVKQEEFEERVELLRDRLYKMAFTYLGSEALAMDAVDEYLGYR